MIVPEAVLDNPHDFGQEETAVVARSCRGCSDSVQCRRVQVQTTYMFKERNVTLCNRRQITVVPNSIFVLYFLKQRSGRLFPSAEFLSWPLNEAGL